MKNEVKQLANSEDDIDYKKLSQDIFSNRFHFLKNVRNGTCF